MDIVYPYNETLPKQTAHDVYLFRNCASLGRTGLSVSLLCGWGSLDQQGLHRHYQVPECPTLSLYQLPILRKLGPLSWNQLFFWTSQRNLEKTRPKWILTSVCKQADYYLRHRLPESRYVYEVHQLGWYPTHDTPSSREAAHRERAILQKMDLVTTTTQALKRILQNAPYSLQNPIEVVPLAVETTPLPPAPVGLPFTLMYIGQLYASQGVELLLQAFRPVRQMHLEIVGGTPEQVTRLRRICEDLGIADRVRLHGFVPPAALGQYAQRAHAFVAPFLAVERMPYVAHTKLLEYASWSRPIIAPDLEVIREHTASADTDLLFTPGDATSLTRSLQVLLAADRKPRVYNYSWDQRGHDYRRVLEGIL